MGLVHFLCNILFIGGCWSLGLITLLGWGLAAERLGWKNQRDISFSRAAWLGLLIVLALLQLAHFVSPIDARLTLPLLLVGAFMLFLCRADLLLWLRTRRPSRAQCIILLVFALWIILISIRPQRDGDTMLYHHQAVLWTQQYPLVIGIGNLHGRLAFNVESDLLFAALASGPWSPYPLAVANGFYFLLFLASVGHSFRPNNAASRSLRWFWIFFLPQLAIWAYVAPGSLPNDMAPFTFLTIATTFLLEAIISPAADTIHPQPPRDLLLTLAGALAIGAILLKLSALAYAAGLLLVCILVARKIFPFLPLSRRLLIRWGAAALLLLGPWILRNVLLSGCLVYPVAATRLPLSWAEPLGWIRFDAYCIHVEAMWNDWPPPNATYPAFLRHLVHALLNEYYSSILPALLGLALLLPAFRARTKALRPFVPFLIPFAFATLFWFTSAPTLRFFGPIVWLFAAVAAAAFATAYPTIRTGGALIGAVFCALLAGLGPWWGLVHSSWSHNGPPQLLWDCITPHPTADGNLPPPWTYPMTTATSRFGVTVNVPVSDEPWAPPLELHPYPAGQVGEAPIPASPYVHPALRLRHPPDLAAGFFIDPVPVPIPVAPTTFLH